jgi:hypothetical protein
MEWTEGIVAALKRHEVSQAGMGRATRPILDALRRLHAEQPDGRRALLSPLTTFDSKEV